MVSALEKVEAKISQLIRDGRWPQVVLLEAYDANVLRFTIQKIAKIFYCETQSACQKCAFCMRVQINDVPDMLWFRTEERVIKIEHVRSFSEHLQYHAESAAVPRLLIIEEIDKLNHYSGNALLKLLEESLTHAVILMTSTRPGGIMDTVLSRCVRWRLPSDYLPTLDEELAGKVKALLSADNATDLSLRAADLAKSSSGNELAFVDMIELVLHDVYRDQHVAERDKVLSNYRLRREQLRSLRKLMVRQKIQANVQMACEGIALGID